MTFSDIPEGLPIWVTIVIILASLFLTLSKRLEELKGPLGWLARWWGSRQVREVQNRLTLDKHIKELVDSRMEGVDGTIQALKRQVDQLRKDLNSEREAWRKERTEMVRDHADEVARLREENQERHSYNLWVTAILRAVEVWAADEGLELPPPKFQTYDQWLRSRSMVPPTARNPPDK